MKSIKMAYIKNNINYKFFIYTSYKKHIGGAIMDFVRLGTANLKSHIGDRVGLEFQARDVSVRLQKDKVTKFIVFNMVDKDTVVEARLFGADERAIELLVEGGVYLAAVDIKPYDKSSTGFSCIIYNIDVSNTPCKYFADWADNLDHSRKVIENMLGNCIDTIYGQIAYPIIIKHWDKFAQWTAASNMHHCQLGGLLKHTAEVIETCELLADFYNETYTDNFINKPLLLCSAALHDVGKIYELDVNTFSGKTEYSEHSVFSTHIMDILREVDIQAYDLGLGEKEIEDDEGNIQSKTDEAVSDEREAVDLLKHCLAAHHGKLEFGSPITASVPEATLLNMADIISAEMYKSHKVIKALSPGESTSIWSGGAYTKYYKDTTKVDELATEIKGEQTDEK